MNPEKIITRFPPSPTGYLHIGSVRTALFNYLFTKRYAGVMYLRFEDTDKARSKREFEDDILKGLNWLGITYTLPTPYRQSERTEDYKKALARLLEGGAAYTSNEVSNDDPDKQIAVIRLKNPGRSITFTDLIRGDITFDTTELGDFVIAKGMEDPLYHLTVVVDDAEMLVTHVMRGEDHISNTARQILILEALGYTRPKYAHIPLILAPDRSKLSKRHGAVSVNEYQTLGYIPEALINYLTLLGWSPGGERELYMLKELEGLFDVDHIQKSGAIFNVEKLAWFNHEHLKRLSDDDFAKRVREFSGKDMSAAIVPLIKERAQTLAEAVMLMGEYDFLHDVSFDTALLCKGAKAEKSEVKTHLEKTFELVASITNEDFTAEKIKEALFPYATEVGRSKVLWPMRVALSGRERSPDPFTLAGILGKEKTISRLKNALAMVK